MNHRVSITAALLLASAAALSAFAINYNSSKSNSGNIVVAPPSVTGAQANAILASIDKSRGTPTEASIRALLTATGVKQGAIKSIVIEQNQGKTTVLLLENSTDETAARASASKVTGTRSNTQHN